MGKSLVTKAKVKTYADINSINSDAIITQLIPQVSEYVKSYCKRSFLDFVTVDKVEIINGGTPYIYLAESPTISITSVEISKDYGVTYTVLTDKVDFILDQEKDRIQCLGVTEFPYIPNGYRIKYKAGYTEIPLDLELAILDIIVYYLKSDMSVKSNASAGKNSVAVEYITSTRLPSHISRVLDLYIKEYN